MLFRSNLPPGKTWYPLYRRLGRPQGRSGQARKISPPPGFDPRTVQPVAVAIPTELPGTYTHKRKMHAKLWGEGVAYRPAQQYKKKFYVTRGLLS